MAGRCQAESQEGESNWQVLSHHVTYQHRASLSDRRGRRVERGEKVIYFNTYIAYYTTVLSIEGDPVGRLGRLG